MKKIQFRKETIDTWPERQAEISKAVCEYLGKDFDVIFKTVSTAKDIPQKDTFFFREHNFKNLVDIRSEVGKLLTDKIRSDNFNDFVLTIKDVFSPSNDQRAYYFGVVIPTIKKHFDNEGNVMTEKDLDEAIRYAIAEEFGLYKEDTNPFTGKVDKRILTLSNAGNMTEVRKYIDAVLIWAARDHGLEIPSPDYNIKTK